MKTKKLNRILLLLSLFIGINVLFDGIAMPSICAATTTTQAQKQKEKAKAAKEKEKAKQKAAKEKEKEKAAKAKAKEQAAKAKAKEQAAKEKAKGQAAKSQPAKPTAEELYQLKVQEVEQYNAKVAAYMARDIAHRLGVWGQVGYSSLLGKDFKYDPANQYGFQSQAMGNAGFGLGLGYQLRYKRFLLTTGAEAQFYNCVDKLYGESKDHPAIIRSYGMAPYTDKMTYHYFFQGMTENTMAGYVQIPLLMGMEFYQDKLYFLAGAKAGINVLGTSSIKTNLTTTITDVELSDPIGNASNHGLVTDKLYQQKGMGVSLGMNVALSAEIGVNLEQFIPVKTDKKKTKEESVSQRLRYRVGLFAEYGVLNILQPSAMYTNDMPAVLLTNPDPTQLSFTSSYMTDAAKGAKANPFMIGVKVAVFYELPRKQLKPMRMPTEPMPQMVARVTDESTGKGLAGAQVTITSEEGKVFNKTSNAKGLIEARYAKGKYAIKAEKMGYYSDSIQYTHSRDLRDTLQIALRPEPKPIIYTFCGYAMAGDTRLPLEADVKVSSATDVPLYEGTSADDGLFVTQLLSDTYIVHLRAASYMPLDDTIRFEQDTIRFYMTKIKEGIRVKINNLFFATNKTFILPESAPALEDLASFLNENDAVTIRITGHTDNVGSDEANMILSQGRANAVKMELVKRGIDPARMEVEGKGETEPVADNNTEEGRAANRRVEFTILSTNGEDIQQIK